MPEVLKAAYLQAEMTQWRHAFHQQPELGFEERLTAKRVAELLQSFGVEVHSGIGGTGVVGVLKRGRSNRCIGIRADMDALPIQEVNTFGHASKVSNTMHACGHDGHISMLLGAAKTLAEHGEFDGTIVFIFQPNEENGLGAPAMLKDGLFDRFDVGEVYGMHNIPSMPLGTFATRSGPITASESLFEIHINARGGHAALPHMGVDAITVGAEIVGSLQTIVSRKLDPSLNGVVSITAFDADGKRNVLPGRAVLSGDARALTPEVNQRIEVMMRQIVDGICMAHGVSATVHYETIFPAVINDSGASKAAVAAACSLVGARAVDGDCMPKLFSEDFAYFATARAGCFILMGNGERGSHARPLHSADYDFNDEGLSYGASLWVQLVEDQLSQQ